jgi:hypothetical protein
MISKNGIVSSNNLYESKAMNIANSSYIGSYTPGTGTNSCLNQLMIPFTDYTEKTTFHIRVLVTYSGFDTSNENGIFDMWFQGDVRKVSDNTTTWNNNYMTSKLNNYKNLKVLVLSSESGIFQYDTTFTIPASWFETYNGIRLGIRSDYSNGTGKITISNVEVMPEKYYIGGGTALRVGEDYIAVNEFYEL